ncbi:MAG: MFS transporter [Candidatus Muiribacteriaceae bacterium]
MDLLIFQNKNFGLLWFGQLVSQLGDKVFQIAMMWYVLELTGSSRYVSYVLFFNLLPVVLLAAFSGVLVDRMNKKMIIVLSDLLRGMIVIGISWMVFTENAGIPHVLSAIFFLGCFTALFNPAISASVPLISGREKLGTAMAWQSSLRDMSAIFGAGIGGVLVSMFGITVSFFINGISYVLSAVFELPISIPEVKKDIRTGFFSDLREGFDFVFHNRTLKHMLILFMIMNFFGPPVMIIIPVMVKRLSLSAGYLGYFEMSLALGSLLGALTVNRITPKDSMVGFISFQMFASGLVLAAIGFFGTPLYIITLQFIMGITLAYININLMILFQKSTPDEMKGRFFSILETFSILVVPISFLIFGITVDKFGYVRNLWLMGGAICLSSLYFLIIPGIKDVVKNDT